jgi:hypothetical protein
MTGYAANEEERLQYWYTIKTFFMLQIAESRSQSPAIF